MGIDPIYIMRIFIINNRNKKSKRLLVFFRIPKKNILDYDLINKRLSYKIKGAIIPNDQRTFIRNSIPRYIIAFIKNANLTEIKFEQFKIASQIYIITYKKTSQ